MATNRRNFLKSTTGTALLAAFVPASATLLSFKQKSKKKKSGKALNVVALVETAEEKAEKLKSICLGLIEPTRKEVGCISYNLYQDTTNPGKFIFIENWQSAEHLDVHLKTPHFVKAGAAFGEIVTKEIVVLKLNKLT